jgi:hypothetical protein
MAKSVLTLVGDATIGFVDLIRFILRLERRTLLMDQLGLFIAGKSNVFTTFPARSRELRGEVDDDSHWGFFWSCWKLPAHSRLLIHGIIYLCYWDIHVP